LNSIRLIPDPPARLVQRDLVARARAVDFLRRIAREIEEGEIAADAVLIVTSWGDVHDVTWEGYTLASILSAAASSAFDAYWARAYGREYDPDERAYQRLAERLYRAREAEAKRAAKPWVCSCGDRFATERGREAHIRRPGRWFSNKGHAPAVETEPTRLRAVE
jgi:hypothetical protein